MYHGSPRTLASRDLRSDGEVWVRIFDWIDVIGRGASLGTHNIIPDQIHAIVMEYPTLARDALRFESHQEFLDVHYTLEGDEIIDWIPTAELTPDGRCENDVQFGIATSNLWSSLHQSPGRVAIFYPSDAHRPRIRSTSDAIRKIVVKVREAFLIEAPLVLNSKT